MKLLSVRTENFLKCVLAEVNFAGDRVEICGKNEQGKSSFAKSIWALFGGKDAIPAEPVRDGATESVLSAELDGDFVITKTITRDGEVKLELRNKAGGKYKSPQAILDGFNLKFGFWPEQFIRADEKEQASILRRIVGIDFGKLDASIAAKMAERTGVGREHKQLEGQLAGCRLHKDAPEVETSASTLLETIQQAGRQESERTRLRSAAATEENQIALKQAELERLEKRMRELEQEIFAADARRAEFAAAAAAIEVPDTSEAQSELAALETTNAKVRDNAEHARVFALLEAKAAEYDRLTKGIEELRAEKERTLAEAKFPVEGLGFGENGVTFQGKPFSQASTARKWEVAAAIGFALNPQLKLVYIEHGSLLDEDTLARVERLVAENGGQLLLETVGDSSSAVVMFADGVAHYRDPSTGEWYSGLDPASTSTTEERHEEGTAVPELRSEAAE